MQLQAFLFEDDTIGQMSYGSENDNLHEKRRFDLQRFERHYLSRIVSFECTKCSHCFSKPFPMPLSVVKRNKLYEKYENERVKTSLKKEESNESKELDTDCTSCENVAKSEEFAFWDGIYADLETVIMAFLNVRDLMKMQRVCKRFQHLVHNTKLIQVMYLSIRFLLVCV